MALTDEELFNSGYVVANQTSNINNNNSDEELFNSGYVVANQTSNINNNNSDEELFNSGYVVQGETNKPSVANPSKPYINEETGNLTIDGSAKRNHFLSMLKHGGIYIIIR